MHKDVLTVIGIGGMGLAVARRAGSGKAVLVADFDEQTLHAAAATLEAEGHDVTGRRVDVSSGESVRQLAEQAAALGPVTQLVHTAGLSPTQASAEAIMHVDPLGVAHVLEEFGAVVAPGGAGVVIASMAGHIADPFTAEQERALTTAGPGTVLTLPFIEAAVGGDPGMAYAVAKRANHLQVEGASVAWGRRGARVNSISPGVISTTMGHQELASESGAFMRSMVDASATGRLGTPDDIAAVAAFLLSDAASFVTGTDVLVDGGVVAALHAGQLG
jgi:NAD(P)-dependent dehydrogenase (short-subunit alcohol dehydrogenase family)